MADSSNSRSMSYYCHTCKCRISSITESFTCPNCDQGFIEEVENQQPDNSNDVFSIFTSSGDPPQADNIFNLLNQITLFNNPGNPADNQLGRMLSSFIGGSQVNGGPFFRLLHGNPEDYVWTTNDLDTVITQLLNQIDNAGPPPMSQEEINSLNEISVTKEHINLNLQCPICMEDFVLDEKVKELTCHHFFHNDCIVEWLKLHATCPTCRTSFSTSDNTKNPTNSSSTTNATNSTNRPQQENATTSNSNNHQAPGYDFSDDLD